ncbi:MAG TPA: nuclear transport factor 2 family protein [Cyclobacteriaceae bacterium]
MKTLLVIGAIFFISFSIAQPFSPMVQEVIDAENGFASLSKTQNTREAFVANFADDGIVFEKASPVLGKEIWSKRAADNSLLFWWPVFSDVSTSGDFGYNTGPFEWSADRSGARPKAYGYFSSVWKKGEEGVWKVVIDMGIGLPTGEEKSSELTTSKKKPAKVKTPSVFEKAKQELLDWDKKYVDQLNMQSLSFIPSHLSDEARVHRTGHFPLKTKEEIKSFTDSRENYHLDHLGGDMAASGDLAYTYGKVNASNAENGKQVTLNYLRIWKKEDGKNWKIVLDVIGG